LAHLMHCVAPVTAGRYVIAAMLKESKKEEGAMRIVTIIGLVVLLAATACSGSSDTCNYSNCPRPEWADTPPVLGAVGIAQGINIGMARKLATDSGRQQLARQIAVKVMGVLDQSAQQVVGANPGEITGHQYAEEITRTLHKQFLTGSRAVKFYTDCCTGEQYALVSIDQEGLANAANTAAKLAAQKILKQAEAKHQELSDKMEEILAKEFPGQ